MQCVKLWVSCYDAACSDVRHSPTLKLREMPVLQDPMRMAQTSLHARSARKKVSIKIRILQSLSRVPFTHSVEHTTRHKRFLCTVSQSDAVLLEARSGIGLIACYFPRAICFEKKKKGNCW